MLRYTVDWGNYDNFFNTIFDGFLEINNCVKVTFDINQVTKPLFKKMCYFNQINFFKIDVSTKSVLKLHC